LSPDDVSAWIERARSGESVALGESLERQRERLRAWAERKLGRGLAQRVDASDVLQLTFLEAHRDFGAFRGSTEAQLVAWLRQILEHNAAAAVRDHAVLVKRAVGREEPMAGAPESALAARQSSPSRRAARVEEAMILARALDALPPDQREAVRLRHLEGRSLGDIAVRMQRSQAAVAGLLERGMSALRKQLDQGESLP
jgi:RNA polymerase sigma-70 factor, ECF subfamily